MAEKRSEYIHARVPASLTAKLAEKARERGETASVIIFRAVAREVGHSGPDKDRRPWIKRDPSEKE